MAFQRKKPAAIGIKADVPPLMHSCPPGARGHRQQALDCTAPRDHRSRAKTHQRGSDFGGGDAHRLFTAAQNCSVTAVVSSVTSQPFVSALSLANLCSIWSIFLMSAYGF